MKTVLGLLTAAALAVTVPAQANVIAFSASLQPSYGYDSGGGVASFLAPLNNGKTSLNFTTTASRQWVKITYSTTCLVSDPPDPGPNLATTPGYVAVASVDIKVDGKETAPEVIDTQHDYGPGGPSLFCTGLYNQPVSGHLSVMYPVGPGKHAVQVYLKTTSGAINTIGNWYFPNTNIQVEE